ncbi:hypothetical protein [Streptomyces minutiscleroticus]|uniref:Uncharacterized protein n=1 Tax=Streptomyces minutiscleroticus TaxID=68238 RepID=A0A918P0Z3_9ACTN|nr:hypothetical protein [Streptomyces minutiscleroticus]GGY12274.1 hypothetical protein GCM10010358_75820 [Streptomyces minutiscleroticus]
MPDTHSPRPTVVGTDAAAPYGTSADASRETRSDVPRTDVVRTALWVLLVVSAVGNMIATYSGGPTAAHLVCGAVSTLCIAGLVVRRLRERR